MTFLKREKPEKSGETVTTNLKDHPAYSAAVLRSSEVNEELVAHRKKLATLKMQANRLNWDARAFVTNQAMALPSMAQPDFDAIALRVLQGGSLMNEVAAARSGACADLYGRLHLQDAGDLEFLKNLDDERAAVMILERAVTLQSGEVLKQKNVAMVEIVQSLRPKRERIARQIAKAITELRAALAEEQEFGYALTLQDEGFASKIFPPLFPERVLLDAEIRGWMTEAHRSGLVDSSEGRPNLDATALASGVGSTIAAGTL